MLAVADRISVLRKGAVVASVPVAGATEHDLVSAMLGERDAGAAHAMPRRETAGATLGDPAIEIVSADVPDPAERMHLSGISLSIAAGEIVGVAGVAGNGQKELGELMLGLRKCRNGSMRVRGEDATGWSPAPTARRS